MLIPFISSKYSTSKKRANLERRRPSPAGGGGGGRGGGSTGGGSRGGSSSGSSSTGGSRGGTSGSSGTGSSSSSGRSSPISSGGSSTGRSASPFSNGGGSTSFIPSGSTFAGRSQGGGTRSDVYGTRTYGSGYPGVSSAGVASRGFPFYFWPVTWGGAAGVGSAAYYHNANSEYGRPNNSSRPGGAMAYATFVDNESIAQNATFHIVADNTTVADLITDIYSRCGSSINNSTGTASPISFNDSDPSAPHPESVIQYYRASSVALTLDGYNNSATWSNATDSTPDTPLPSNIDSSSLKQCLNETIGNAVPLVDADSLSTSAGGNSGLRLSGPDIGLVSLVLVFLHVLGVLS